MVKSKNYGFEVSTLKILQKACEDQTKGDITSASYEPLREMISPLGIYVVATPNQEFIIELKGPDSQVYGAKLWIDEQEIFYKKTFKGRGFFMGFKLGEGRFNSFKFAPPTFESKDAAAFQLTRSEIKVVFYKVTEKYVSDDKLFQKSIRKAQDVYVPGVVKENKKFFRKSLTVQAGDVIYKPGLDKRELFDKMKDRKSRKYVECNIDYDNVLDTLVVHYGDFNSLLVQGVLSLANYDHLNVIPLHEIKRKPKIVERILMTIVRKYSAKGLMLQQIEEEFNKMTRQSFEDLEVGPLVSFISLRNELFQVDENNYLRCSETAKNIYLDLRDVDPKKGIVPPVYFQTGFETKLKKNDQLYGKFNSFRQEHMGEKPKSSKGNLPIMIDLTQD